ncbi:uncharacterized protein [Dermacentor albipictus]|uniref:uncharacterized protein isoform X2 n=1 Tax=Dermacentor albipictus TaxID=60249 RepID=UPI0031FC6A1A
MAALRRPRAAPQDTEPASMPGPAATSPVAPSPKPEVVPQITEAPSARAVPTKPMPSKSPRDSPAPESAVQVSMPNSTHATSMKSKSATLLQAAQKPHDVGHTMGKSRSLGPSTRSLTRSRAHIGKASLTTRSHPGSGSGMPALPFSGLIPNHLWSRVMNQMTSRGSRAKSVATSTTALPLVAGPTAGLSASGVTVGHLEGGQTAGPLAAATWDMTSGETARSLAVETVAAPPSPPPTIGTREQAEQVLQAIQAVRIAKDRQKRKRKKQRREYDRQSTGDVSSEPTNASGDKLEVQFVSIEHQLPDTSDKCAVTCLSLILLLISVALLVILAFLFAEGMTQKHFFIEPTRKPSTTNEPFLLCICFCFVACFITESTTYYRHMKRKPVFLT